MAKLGSLQLLVILSVFSAAEVLAQKHTQQHFRVAPKNTRVHEGGEAVLTCEIGSLGGAVQWAKDGFALGFQSPIPGFPRYSVTGDHRNGVYNLRIVNASLEDDADYQCQVGPARLHKVIRATATLTVIAPPTMVEIIGHRHNSLVEVQNDQELTLTCQALSAKPVAKIVWSRNKGILKPDRRDDVTVVESGHARDNKSVRFTVKSTIQLKVTADDDLTDFTCEARHEALQRDLPMRSTVQLSVQYPPGVPYIEGFTEGDIFYRGQTVELICMSRGGNPPAQLVWYKNNEQVTSVYSSVARLSENVVTFVADTTDDKSVYRCDAENIMVTEPLSAQVKLTVFFAPTQVTISGPKEARVGDSVVLTCETTPSNPPAQIKWMIYGKPFRNATNITTESPKGGWITSSNMTVAVDKNRKSIQVVCHGVNSRMAENVMFTHNINILHPPSAPFITGYEPGTPLAAGTVQKILCVSSGGNPPATLTWYKNDKKVHSQTRTASGDKSVSSEITILTNVTDNLAQYRCEATNSATEIPLFETVVLSVHFAPETVQVTVDPAVIKHGESVVMTCNAASSNPPAVLSWWKDGISVQESSVESKQGLHGGTVSSITLNLNVSREMNGAVYTCQALNKVLQRSVNYPYTMNVTYPPLFDSSNADSIIGVEGEPLVVTVTADANPDSVAYTWTKDGLPILQYSHGQGSDRITSDRNLLNITRLTRHDAGIYVCEAVNSQGAATFNISINVHYGMAIKAVSENTIFSPNEDATLSCLVTGNPLSEDLIQWKRDGYPELTTKTTTSFVNNTSVLKIHKATREDVGVFQCVANNGIGNETRQDVMLIVKFKPEMDLSPSFMKSASNNGGEAKLRCRCKAAPAPNFTWSKSGATIPTNTSGKYFVTFRKVDPLTYESVLLVEHVTSTDYGQYECASRNEVGFSTNSIKLDVLSAPDQVSILTVENVTHDSVSLTWVPGFDGGETPTYRIRYRKITLDNYKYEDVVPQNTTVFTITGLERSTDYVFSIMALNKLGQSRYRPDATNATTLRASQIGEMQEIPTVLLEKADLPQMFIVYVSITGVVLVITNVALVACFMLRKRAKRIKEQAGQTSKSGAELYTTSSYNDTMNGETLSSVSEKSETYSNEDQDNENDHHMHHLRIHPPPIPEVPNMQPGNMGQNMSPYHEEPLLAANIPADCPPPNYVDCDTNLHARTLPHPHHNNPQYGVHFIEKPKTATLNRNTGKQSFTSAPSPMPPLDGSYYNMSSDRYLSYPPMMNDYISQSMIGRTPTPPEEYGPPIPPPPAPPSKIPPCNNPNIMHNGGFKPPLNPNINMGNTPPPNYVHQELQVSPIYVERPSGGTLRRHEKMTVSPPIVAHRQVPPPDVTVLHANCNQHSRPTQTLSNAEKQPQSILKDPSRHQQKQYNAYNQPNAGAMLNNASNQILMVQNLAGGDQMQMNLPAYGTIRKDHKKNNATNTSPEMITPKSETHIM